MLQKKHVSFETAKRDIADLVARGVLAPNPGGGRSASYDLVGTEPVTRNDLHTTTSLRVKASRPA